MNSTGSKNRRTKRTTVTLEADVADFIQTTLSRHQGLKENQLINKLLRSGIKNETSAPAARFKIEGFKSELLASVSEAGLERKMDDI